MDAQVARGESYRERSENNRLRHIPIFAERGGIYDRNNQEMAYNVPSEDDFSEREYIKQKVFARSRIYQLAIEARAHDGRGHARQQVPSAHVILPSSSRCRSTRAGSAFFWRPRHPRGAHALADPAGSDGAEQARAGDIEAVQEEGGGERKVEHKGKIRNQ